ncbi:hypothetical protein HHI36_000507 [Cryptolaemus montrouzieri]
MEFQTVLVESVDPKSNTVYGNSGMLLNENCVISTFNAIAPFYSTVKNIYQEIQPGITYCDSKEIKKVSFYITSRNEELFKSRKAHFKGYIHSENISRSVKHIFRNWSIDSSDNHDFELLSLFAIFKLDESKNEPKDSFDELFERILKTRLSKGQNLKCISTAFGNRNFSNHYSEGIVSNILGNYDCLIFSDLPLTPGSEGSPVFCNNLSEAPIGIVISAVNWWKNEWLNFTVIADLRPLLLEIIETSKYTELKTCIDGNFKLMSTIEASLFQVYNGTIWGTAILINKEKGILITNAHVVDPTSTNTLYRNNESIPCDVVYSSSGDQLDIAVLRAKRELKGSFQAIRFSRRTIQCGDSVYAAGFPIFAKETTPSPTLTRGCISQVHPQMVKTTCSIYPGASGGGILDEDGCLLAIIVCNAKITDFINMVYPRVNMNIPVSILEPILLKYIANEDVGVLEDINLLDARVWNFSSKF